MPPSSQPPQAGIRSKTMTAPTAAKTSRFKTREEPQAVSTLLLQVATSLPKSAKTPSDTLHAIAKIIYENDWNHLTNTIADSIATCIAISNPCDKAAADICKVTQQLQKVSLHLPRTNSQQEPTTLGFATSTYANVVAYTAAPHAQAIATGERQDWQFFVKIKPTIPPSTHALSNLLSQELV
ncbi:hypothetical protein BDQ17DRAFT_1436467 [Cyathus striatus]|nr:hypothetical protein BDQ17DRAFT_1436467 [Cyathus striatus]